MGINITVVHDDINAHMLAALLWDGIELEAARSNGWADGIAQRVVEGRSDTLSQVPQSEVRFYVRLALELHGRRSVECGSSSERWNDAVEKWCRDQVKRTYKV